ncbi:MAG: NAD+ synthase [Bdellovibrionales bacterium]
MDIAIAQINSHLGNLHLNTQKIIEYCNKASEEDSNFIVFPELSLLGYSPNDLLERPELYPEQQKVLKAISEKIPKKISLLLGCLNKENGRLFNSAVLIQNNTVKKYFNKTLLPNYDVFDESRHFHSGNLNKNFFTLKGKKILVTICEDLWFSDKDKYKKDPLNSLTNKPDYIVSLNASPFEAGKQKVREDIVKNISQKFSCPVAYVNTVGAQDELIFDGLSFITDSKGKVTTRLPAFKEHLYTGGKVLSKTPSRFSSIESALVLGVKDYFLKTGFSKAHLGLSGGIDSALVIYLAAKALGPENVTGIALPGPHSSKLSLQLAKKLSKNLGTNFIKHDTNKVYNQFIKDFDKTFEKQPFGLMHENVQARLRALTLMAFSNNKNSLLLATSNKSELTVGYSTLYGDQCGAIMPIGDLLKTDVFKLCKWINKRSKTELIPGRIITRPPSAELRANQKDSDSLPDYEKLDKSIQKVITLQKKPTNVLDRWVLNRSYISEFKRWQAAPILKISEHAYGIGRRMPIAHKFKS